MNFIQTDVCIIGAGPVGLFAVFECGLLKMKCHLVDALPQVGGQLSEIYPQKPIYDIPGYPSVLAGDLVNNLMKQIEPFSPGFSLGERVESVEKRGERDFVLTTSMGTRIEAGVVVIAGGLGSFEPRKPDLPGLDKWEQKGVDYMVRDPERYSGKRVVIAGGGDSALDWTMYLADICESLILVHRRGDFRGALDSGSKVEALADAGKVQLLLNTNLTGLDGGEWLTNVEVVGADKQARRLEADYLIPLYGLSPKLGPIAEWGLQIEQRAVQVNTRDYSTSEPGIYAIGDINTYPGKLKLILCGFHESALMAHSAYQYLHPGQTTLLKYTTVTGIEGM